MLRLEMTTPFTACDLAALCSIEFHPLPEETAHQKKKIADSFRIQKGVALLMLDDSRNAI